MSFFSCYFYNFRYKFRHIFDNTNQKTEKIKRKIFPKPSVSIQKMCIFAEFEYYLLAKFS